MGEEQCGIGHEVWKARESVAVQGVACVKGMGGFAWTCASPDKTLFLGDRCAGGSGFRAELQELSAGADCAAHFFHGSCLSGGGVAVCFFVIWERCCMRKEAVRCSGLPVAPQVSRRELPASCTLAL